MTGVYRPRGRDGLLAVCFVAVDAAEILYTSWMKRLFARATRKVWR